jgi:hypothetical protein
MRTININPSKHQTKKVSNKEIKLLVWEASRSSHPVTFGDPENALKASRLKSCELKGGLKAYSLFIPVMGTKFQTAWYIN